MKSVRLITRRRAKWAGVAAVLTAALVLSVSMVSEVAYSRTNGETGLKRSFRLHGGGISHVTQDVGKFIKRHNSMHLDKSPPPESGQEFSVRWQPTTRILLKPETHEFRAIFVEFVYVPLWPIVAILAVPTAWLWYTDRSAKPWQCAKCRYDLRGLEGGGDGGGEGGGDKIVCPECGSAKGEG